MQVKSFGTQKETDAWFLDNPARSPGALHIVDRNTTVISYGIQPNSSVLYIVPFQQIFLKFQIPLQIAAEREIARTLIGGTSITNSILFHPQLRYFTCFTIIHFLSYTRYYNQCPNYLFFLFSLLSLISPFLCLWK